MTVDQGLASANNMPCYKYGKGRRNQNKGIGRLDQQKPTYLNQKLSLLKAVLIFVWNLQAYFYRVDVHKNNQADNFLV